MMLTVYDRSRKKVTVLQNAYAIKEERKLGAVWMLSFSLPLGDFKHTYCQPFWYVECESRLYRIQPSSLSEGESGSISYSCEHVIASLMDNVLYGYHVVGNLGVYTKDSIQYLLSRQLVKNWVLDQCDFTRQFEYGWEQENLLGALFSIPKPFTEAYRWDYDTTVYPWRLKLLRMEQSAPPKLYIRKGKNILSLTRQSDPQNICTRLYPLGYGEGVNQLTIKSVNAGSPYLQSPKEYTDRYGIVERVWVDRRYENPGSLLEAAKGMLHELQEPAVEYTVSFVHVSGDEKEMQLGKKVRISSPETGVDFDTFITGITMNFDEMASSQLTIANRPKDIASTVADLADRQRVEMTYSQGATQLYAQSLQGNADSKNGTILDFFIPSEMRIVNKVVAKVRLSQFRAYSKATASGGGSTQTSSSGGGTNTSTSSGGGTSSSSTNGAGVKISVGDISETRGVLSGSSGITGRENNRQVGVPQLFTMPAYGAQGGDQHMHEVYDHNHSFDMPVHSHDISHGHTASAASHSHNFSIGAHSHSFTISDHSHSVKIPEHGHEIAPGIYFFGGASSFGLYLGGKLKQTFSGSTAELDLTSYLVDSNGKIPRGSWQSVEIRPSGLAYVVISVMVQGFVQSRGDNTV